MSLARKPLSWRPGLLMATLFFVSGLAAQQHDELLIDVGWYPVPDSLALIWKLDDDQVYRLRVLGTDLDKRLAELLADPALTEGERQRTLRGLAATRRSEIERVLRTEQFEDWLRRYE
ncbi:MAG: hypothetical protein R2815_05115 [Flavobacteriales bacterium]